MVDLMKAAQIPLNQVTATNAGDAFREHMGPVAATIDANKTQIAAQIAKQRDDAAAAASSAMDKKVLKFLGQAALVSAAGGVGFAALRSYMKPEAERYLAEEGSALPIGSSVITHVPAVEEQAARAKKRKRLLAQQQADSEAAMLKASDGENKDPGTLARFGNQLQSHWKTVFDRTTIAKHPLTATGLLFGVPLAFGGSYMLTRKILNDREKARLAEEEEKTKRLISHSLRSEYSEGNPDVDEEEFKAAALGAGLDKLAEAYINESLVKVAAGEDDLAVNQVGARQPAGKSPAEGLGAWGAGALMAFMLGLGYLGYHGSKRVFDRGDENRARAKALKEALKYHMQLRQPRILVSPISEEDEQESPAVRRVMDAPSPSLTGVV